MSEYTSTIHAFLNQIHPISSAEMDAFAACLQPKSATKGACLLLEGEVQRDLYFILEGVQMSHYHRRDKQFVTAFTYPPGVAAVPDSFLYQIPSKYTFECLTDSRFLTLSFESRAELLQRFPVFETLFRKFAEALVAGLVERVTELQSHTMEERFRIFCARSPHLLQLAPHKYIASYLGIDPTNFSKLYNSIRI